jgi:hypothetical protein
VRSSRSLFHQLVSEPGWPSAFSDKSRLTMCEGEIVGNSPTLCGDGEIAWFIWLRVQPPNRLAFWGECWPKRPKARCYTCGRVCRGPIAWVGAPCGRAAPTDTPCRRSGSNNLIVPSGWLRGFLLSSITCDFSCRAGYFLTRAFFIAWLLPA